MRFIGHVIEKLQRHPKRVVFPEGYEERVLQAARQFAALRLGTPVLLGDRTRIKTIAQEININLHGIRLLDPRDSDDLADFARRFARLRRSKGVTEEQAREILLEPNYFGAMMLAMHQVDGLVSGVNETSGSALRPLFQIVKVAPGTPTASSCMIMEVEDSQFGEQGVLGLADCAVIPEPNVDQLADLAVGTAQLSKHLLGIRPRVAFLSYSTKSSSTHPSIGRIQAAKALAVQLAEKRGVAADFDGELQVDTALIREIAGRKLPQSPVAGRANVLIFPDLNAANIASKLLQHVAKANAYGQILLGMDRPAALVSRGCSAHEIVGVAGIVGLQSIKYQELYPDAGTSLPGD